MSIKYLENVSFKSIRIPSKLEFLKKVFLHDHVTPKTLVSLLDNKVNNTITLNFLPVELYQEYC